MDRAFNFMANFLSGGMARRIRLFPTESERYTGSLG